MFEFLRRLTADYTEEEYINWLHEVGPMMDTPLSVPTISENEHIKDIACMLVQVSDETGYPPEFLYEMFDEEVNDGWTHKEAFDHVAGISYEHDW